MLGGNRGIEVTRKQTNKNYLRKYNYYIYETNSENYIHT